MIALGLDAHEAAAEQIAYEFLAGTGPDSVAVPAEMGAGTVHSLEIVALSSDGVSERAAVSLRVVEAIVTSEEGAGPLIDVAAFGSRAVYLRGEGEMLLVAADAPAV